MSLGTEIRGYIRHLATLFAPGAEAPAPEIDHNTPGSLKGWTDADLQQLVDEGRRQIDRQHDDLERIRSRSQVILALSIALLGAAAAIRSPVSRVDCLALWALWVTAILVGVLAGLGAAATATARADMEIIHAGVLSRRSTPVLRSLAADYAAMVPAGENQVAVRLTNMRWSVTLLLAAGVLAVSTWTWADAAGSASKRKATPSATPAERAAPMPTSPRPTP